ncbi:MAG TPA: RodZ domain-containing protein [Steroidobacteraceae bacterium]|jgi:cytoskeleton protein RodZ|nr:RodZ domain-containing protein [Steroidobacteraceae bacterium]
MDEGAPQSQSSSPGARLAAAREHAGMTLTQVAERLRLDIVTLQALEAGRFQTLGAAVFVRGHLRHYAELVGLPVEEIEAAYAASSARLAPLPDLRRTTTLPGTSASRGVALPPRAALIGAIVLVLAGWIWWAVRVPAGQRHAANPPATTTSPVPPAGPQASDAVDAGPQPSADAAVAPKTAAAPSRDTTATSKEAAAAPSAPPKAGSARVRLAIRFNQDSWIEIYDAHGATLYHDFGGAGSERHLSGAAPLRILLGNPDGVALELDGHPVALRPAAESGRPQRFLLDDSGRISEVPAPQSQRAPSAPSAPP